MRLRPFKSVGSRGEGLFRHATTLSIATAMNRAALGRTLSPQDETDRLGYLPSDIERDDPLTRHSDRHQTPRLRDRETASRQPDISLSRHSERDVSPSPEYERDIELSRHPQRDVSPSANYQQDDSVSPQFQRNVPLSRHTERDVSPSPDYAHNGSLSRRPKRDVPMSRHTEQDGSMSPQLKQHVSRSRPPERDVSPSAKYKQDVSVSPEYGQNGSLSRRPKRDVPMSRHTEQDVSMSPQLKQHVSRSRLPERDVSPSANYEQDDSLPHRSKRDVSPSLHPEREVSPSAEYERDVPVSRRLEEDGSSSSDYEPDVSLSRRLKEDVSSPRHFERDVLPSRQTEQAVSMSPQVKRRVSQSRHSEQGVSPPLDYEQEYASLSPDYERDVSRRSQRDSPPSHQFTRDVSVSPRFGGDVSVSPRFGGDISVSRQSERDVSLSRQPSMVCDDFEVDLSVHSSLASAPFSLASSRRTSISAGEVPGRRSRVRPQPETRGVETETRGVVNDSRMRRPSVSEEIPLAPPRYYEKREELRREKRAEQKLMRRYSLTGSVECLETPKYYPGKAPKEEKVSTKAMRALGQLGLGLDQIFDRPKEERARREAARAIAQRQAATLLNQGEKPAAPIIVTTARDLKRLNKEQQNLKRRNSIDHSSPTSFNSTKRGDGPSKGLLAKSDSQRRPSVNKERQRRPSEDLRTQRRPVEHAGRQRRQSEASETQRRPVEQSGRQRRPVEDIERQRRPDDKYSFVNTRPRGNADSMSTWTDDSESQYFSDDSRRTSWDAESRDDEYFRADGYRTVGRREGTRRDAARHVSRDDEEISDPETARLEDDLSSRYWSGWRGEVRGRESSSWRRRDTSMEREISRKPSETKKLSRRVSAREVDVNLRSTPLLRVKGRKWNLILRMTEDSRKDQEIEAVAVHVVSLVVKGRELPDIISAVAAEKALNHLTVLHIMHETSHGFWNHYECDDQTARSQKIRTGFLAMTATPHGLRGIAVDLRTDDPSLPSFAKRPRQLRFIQALARHFANPKVNGVAANIVPGNYPNQYFVTPLDANRRTEDRRRSRQPSWQHHDYDSPEYDS